MIIYPAVDIIGGKVVRLLKGDYGKVTGYGLSPSEAAEKFCSDGARYLHAVDLDGAKSGRAENSATVKNIIAAAPLNVEIGGGIRTEEQIERYLSDGADSVVLGTAALRDSAFLESAVKKFGAKIVVGVDASDGKVAVSGWREVTEKDAFSFCERLRDIGVRRVIYTDVSRDGTLGGTNMKVYEKLVRIDGLKITASGGITYLSEIKELKDMGVYGAVIGKALYENKLSLSRAIAAAEE